MADQFYADTDDDDTDLQGDALIKDLRRQISALSKREKALNAELSNLKTGLRDKTVAEVLTAKGVNPKVSRFIPEEIQDEEGINKWLEEYGDAFGLSPAGETPAEPTQAPEQVAEAKRLQALGTNAKAPASALSDISERLAAATSQEEVNKIWAEGAKNFL